AALHKEYGVFLCPSRYDTQGVSRDEGRASGLVAVVSDVAAIPEFVDSDSGFIVGDGDYKGLARAIFSLYESEDLFKRLSKESAVRVRNQVDKKHIVREELALIAGVGHGL
ncbi:glycosyltransferase, partial [Ectopseudomonas oleovorans]|uniref:glycosyltransferase n=1 Tax=Ectopseudomonas oleovorans TaxID=301 RepID=UPI0014836CF2